MAATDTISRFLGNRCSFNCLGFSMDLHRFFSECWLVQSLCWVFFLNPGFFLGGNGKLGRWEDSTFINRNRIFQWKKSRQLSCSESPTRLASQILGKHRPLYHENLRVPPPNATPPRQEIRPYLRDCSINLDRAVWPSCSLSWRDLLGFRWFPHTVCGNVKC